MKFEYKEVDIAYDINWTHCAEAEAVLGSLLLEKLNELGEEGWEFIEKKDFKEKKLITILFKRKKGLTKQLLHD